MKTKGITAVGTGLSLLFLLICSSASAYWPGYYMTHKGKRIKLEADEFVFKVDPPTLHCLGFRWYLGGDDNTNAVGTIEYRKKGTDQWLQASPMLRVNREAVDQTHFPFVCDNLFAGSVLSLTPGTDYEVRLRIDDPDGADADTTVTVRTSTEPTIPPAEVTFHVYPGDYGGKEKRPAYRSLAAVLPDLRPGAHVLLHKGTHLVGTFGLKPASGGIEGKPVVFRVAGDGEAVIDGGGSRTIFDVSEADNVLFEGLTIRNCDTAILADGTSGLTVRRCRMIGVHFGVRTHSAESSGWYIADNYIIGKIENWYPRVIQPQDYTGITVYGRGHVVCHNRIDKFWDCIAIDNYQHPEPDWDSQCVAIDMYNNDLSGAVDDGLETDFGCHNVRVWNNRIINCHTALSVQPFWGGPVYLIGNLAYGIGSINLKFHNYCTGLRVYHNTLVCSRGGFTSFARWQNGDIRNNLFVASSGHAMRTGSPHPRTWLDYNGYRQADPELFIRWYDGRSDAEYGSLAEFNRATGFEEHGVMVDFDIFRKAIPPDRGVSYPWDMVDLSLQPGSAAVDAGMVLTNINEDFSGDGPDLGALELGGTLPVWGPRAE